MDSGDWPEPNTTRRLLGVVAHISVILGFAMVPPLIIPIGILLWAKKNSNESFLELHSKEAINFQLSFTLYGILLFAVSFAFSVLTLGIGALFAIPILIVSVFVGALLILLFVIGAAIDAFLGAKTRYPHTIRFVS